MDDVISKIYGIFSSMGQISMFHEPSMKYDDVFFYILLENSIMIKFKIVDNIIVIYQCYCKSMSYNKEIYEKILMTLYEQKSFSVIISLIEYIGDLKKTCAKLGFPLVENNETYCNHPIYTKLLGLFPEKLQIHGLYLVNLVDDNMSHDSVDLDKKVIQTLTERYKHIEVDDNTGILSLNKEIQIKYLIINDILYITYFNYDVNQSFMMLLPILELFESLEKYFSRIILYRTTSSNLYELCKFKKYEKIEVAQKLEIIDIYSHSFGSFIISGGKYGKK